MSHPQYINVKINKEKCLGSLCNIKMIIVQDLPEKPKYLLALTVGVGQKAFVNEAVQKVSYLEFRSSRHEMHS